MLLHKIYKVDQASHLIRFPFKERIMLISCVAVHYFAEFGIYTSQRLVQITANKVQMYKPNKNIKYLTLSSISLTFPI